MNEKTESLGQRLKWVREKHGMTLAELGFAAHLSGSYLSKLENEKSLNISEDALLAICNATGLRQDWLVSGDGKPFWTEDRNEAAEKGNIPLLHQIKISQKQAVFADSLFVAGFALSFNRTASALADTVASINKNREYGEAMRAEVTRILSVEISARLSSATPSASFERPVSQLGQMAIAAVDAVLKRQGTTATQLEKPENNLTDTETSVKDEDVKPLLPDLLVRLKKATSVSGKKTELATFLGVPLASVSRWLSGEREPGGEITLKLFHWVEQQERQK